MLALRGTCFFSHMTQWIWDNCFIGSPFSLEDTSSLFYIPTPQIDVFSMDELLAVRLNSKKNICFVPTLCHASSSLSQHRQDVSRIKKCLCSVTTWLLLPLIITSHQKWAVGTEWRWQPQSYSDVVISLSSASYMLWNLWAPQQTNQYQSRSSWEKLPGLPVPFWKFLPWAFSHRCIFIVL